MADVADPPPGGDVTRAPLLDGVDWSMTGLALMFVVCRLLSRYKIIRKPGLDDLAITISIVLNIISISFTTAANATGMGRHAYYLTPEQISNAVRLNIIGQPFGIMAFCVPKLAVALLIMRLMPPRKYEKWFLYFITISLIIFSTLAAIFLFIQCSPPQALWNHDMPFHCWPPSILSNYTIFVGAYSAFCDLSLAVFPITIFWNLQMNLKKKIGICLVMGLGVFAFVCAIVKTTKLNELQDHVDFTWATVDLLLWTVVESDMIIICACIPTLRPLVRHIHDNGFTSIFKSDNRKSDFVSGNTDRIALRAFPRGKGYARTDSGRPSFQTHGGSGTDLEMQREAD